MNKIVNHILVIMCLASYISNTSAWAFPWTTVKKPTETYFQCPKENPECSAAQERLRKDILAQQEALAKQSGKIVRKAIYREPSKICKPATFDIFSKNIWQIYTLIV